MTTVVGGEVRTRKIIGGEAATPGWRNASARSSNGRLGKGIEATEEKGKEENNEEEDNAEGKSRFQHEVPLFIQCTRQNLRTLRLPVLGLKVTSQVCPLRPNPSAASGRGFDAFSFDGKGWGEASYN